MRVDKVTLAGPDDICEIRYVKDDGTFHRETREPGADVSDLPDDAKAMTRTAWTDEKVREYRNRPVKDVIDETPRRDLAAELDALKAEVAKLKTEKPLRG